MVTLKQISTEQLDYTYNAFLWLQMFWHNVFKFENKHCSYLDYAVLYNLEDKKTIHLLNVLTHWAECQPNHLKKTFLFLKNFVDKFSDHFSI